MATLGRYLLANDAFDDAASLLRKSLDVQLAQLPDKWETFDTQSMLGAALMGQKAFAEAEPLLLTAHQELLDREASIPQSRKLRLTDSYQRLVKLYQSWRAAKPDENLERKAIEWQGKLDEHLAQANRDE